jgi:hypothetical protein
MSGTIADEKRVLSASEQELVARTHQPQLTGLDADELAQTRKLVRELRDRAQAIASRQRREMRRKADPRGARPAADDSGSRQKVSVLAAALKRLANETRRRAEAARKDSLADSLRQALERKRAAAARQHPGSGRTAGKGMRKVANQRAPQIGSAKEAGRVSQFVRNAQAKRDSR